MDSMTYKGYTAHAAFDDRDSLFVGRILGIRSLLSFHGETVQELRTAFEHAIDDYIRECEEAGVAPA